jgi:magnesium transporter
MLDQSTRNEVIALLTYAQDVAGGLMNPRYIQVRPELRVDEAISYIRKRAREQEQVETIHYIYVLDAEQHLLGIVSMRELFQASPQQKVKDVMHTQIVTVAENLDQEEISSLFGKYALLALPVVDLEGRMKGVVTLDDIVDIVQKEATEDIQKLGGTIALEAPYLHITVWEMVKKRVGWLAVLFVGEMWTANTMQYYEKEIARAVVLALFLPLIISSGGNAGSQASTLVIRALSLGEVRIRDCARVLGRECIVGSMLGVILASIGLMRVLFWPHAREVYGQYFVLIGVAVALSIVGVVLWGALVGSFLPFVLKKVGLDPATASAPFVATFVDVTGLIIYFSVASCILHGTLL